MTELRVLGLQLKVELDCNSKEEYRIDTNEYLEEMKEVKNLISTKNPNVIILPEMCYSEEYYTYFLDLSTDKLIIAGSIYYNGINQTVVFFENKEYRIPKYNASGAEPMIRRIEKHSIEDFLKNQLESHIFVFNSKKIVVLNCMEYYQNAYYIARNIPDLFGFLCVCSNNNPKVFLEESRAIHNHCEDIYTFMVNCVSTYQGKPYGKGESYIYGPIQQHEKEWLKKDGIVAEEHPASILKLGNDSEYFYGEFINDFSRFGRSDNYINNPKMVEVGKIRRKVKK